jgi:mannose-6-phosphate isomerase-like protein (cupin superfamily)
VALLSKIERDKVVPTLPTLTRVALVFGVGLNYFFTEEREKYPIAVVRQGTRKRFPQRQGMVKPSFEFESLDFTAVERKMNSYLAEFNDVDPGDVKMHRHEGAEFLYVLSGSVAIVRNEEEVILEAGDSAYFESHVSHGYRRVGDEPAQAIVVTTV